MITRSICIVAALCVLSIGHMLFGQSETTGFGTLRGIRVDGELMAFTSSIRMIAPNSAETAMTANERVSQPRFTHEGNRTTTAGNLAFRNAAGGGGGGRGRGAAPAGLGFQQVFEDTAPGSTSVDLTLTANSALELEGIYYFITLPRADYAGATAEFMDADAPAPPAAINTPLSSKAKGIRVTAQRRQLVVTFESPTDMVLQTQRRRGGESTELRFALVSGNMAQGQSVNVKFTIKATGEIDTAPIKLSLDPSKPGEPFVGVGGNFRLQNPSRDPAIIQYNLDNMRVAWARVEMPLDSWHADEAADPAQVAAEQLPNNVRQAMEMARTLAERKIPIAVSAWRGPNWALGAAPGRGGNIRGRAILPDKLESICKSMTAYLVYMKQHYNAEADLFSLNESDLGIDIRQTGEEHALLIKTLGAQMAAAGLKTKVLLGDTSDATPFNFIRPAMNDPEAVKYIGAVSFHSWRGGTDEQLRVWGEAARQLKVPLFVGEGGTDAAAYNYPSIFVEPWFSLDEIDLYVRICSLSQPGGILEWQLTSDYSVLTGGPRARGSGQLQPLQTTQRFWQLKQLGSTPAGSPWLQISGATTNVSFAAFGDATRGYSVHLVNNGATRLVTIAGMPPSVKEMRVFVTDAARGMQQAEKTLPVIGGTVELNLEKQTFTSLMSTP